MVSRARFATGIAFTLALGALLTVGCQVLLDIDPNPLVEDGAAMPPVDDACVDPGPDATILTDNFDSGSIDMQVWQLEQAGGTIAIDGTNPHGSDALTLHAQVVADGGTGGVTAYVRRGQSLPCQFFVRFYVYVPSTPAPPSYPSNEIFANVSNQAQGKGIDVYLENGNLQLTGYANEPVVNVPSTSKLGLDGWHCIEVEVTQSAAPGGGSVNAWLDDLSVSWQQNGGTGTTVTGITTPSFDVFELGMSMQNPPVSQQPFQLWEDGLQIATSRIGCP